MDIKPILKLEGKKKGISEKWKANLNLGKIFSIRG
jgi:hypothetical protein